MFEVFQFASYRSYAESWNIPDTLVTFVVSHDEMSPSQRAATRGVARHRVGGKPSARVERTDRGLHVRRPHPERRGRPVARIADHSATAGLCSSASELLGSVAHAAVCLRVAHYLRGHTVARMGSGQRRHLPGHPTDRGVGVPVRRRFNVVLAHRGFSGPVLVGCDVVARMLALKTEGPVRRLVVVW